MLEGAVVVAGRLVHGLIGRLCSFFCGMMAVLALYISAVVYYLVVMYDHMKENGTDEGSSQRIP